MGTRRGGGILARRSGEPEPRSSGRELTVERPEPRAAEERRAQQVNVDPAQAASRERVPLHEPQDLVVLRPRRLRQSEEQFEDRRAAPKIPERELSEDERMTQDLRVLQKGRESSIPFPEMVDPDRRVDEDHREAERGRRRRADRRRGSLPPSAASRRALSRAMRASRPARTTAVFSRTPESCRAFSTRRS